MRINNLKQQVKIRSFGDQEESPPSPEIETEESLSSGGKMDQLGE